MGHGAKSKEQRAKSMEHGVCGKYIVEFLNNIILSELRILDFEFYT